MQLRIPPLAFWSNDLASSLLSSLPNDQLVQLSMERKIQVDGRLIPDHLVALLQRSSRNCGELQLAIMQVWREVNSDVVAGAELIAIDGPPEQCEAMFVNFGSEKVLLEVITADPKFGWEVAIWVVENVNRPDIQRELAEVLTRWATNDSADAGQFERPGEQVRVVVFGGHVRDESKMNERLFDGSPIEVRWKPFEKGGASPTVKTIYDALSTADAALLVTTMVSHNIMQVVKRLSRENRIPFRAIPKATDLYLMSALADLFPGLCSPKPQRFNQEAGRRQSAL